MGGDSERPRLTAAPRRAPTRSVERDAQSDGGGPVGLHDRRGVCKLSAELAAAVPPRHSGRDPACWHGSSAVRGGGSHAARAGPLATAPTAVGLILSRSGWAARTVELCRRMGQREQAQEHLTTATTMYREMGMTYWLERATAELKAFD